MMGQYRKRPVVIEAVAAREVVRCASKDWAGLPKWIVDAYEGRNGAVRSVVFVPDGVRITTLEGTMKADLDDWIIRGVQGELYPCKPDIFEATYEAVG